MGLAVCSALGDGAANAGGSLCEAGNGNREDEHGQYEFHVILLSGARKWVVG